MALIILASFFPGVSGHIFRTDTFNVTEDVNFRDSSFVGNVNVPDERGIAEIFRDSSFVGNVSHLNFLDSSFLQAAVQAAAGSSGGALGSTPEPMWQLIRKKGYTKANSAKDAGGGGAGVDRMSFGIIGPGSAQGVGASHTAPMVSVLEELVLMGHNVWCFHDEATKRDCPTDLNEITIWGGDGDCADHPTTPAPIPVPDGNCEYRPGIGKG